MKHTEISEYRYSLTEVLSALTGRRLSEKPSGFAVSVKNGELVLTYVRVVDEASVLTCAQSTAKIE